MKATREENERKNMTVGGMRGGGEKTNVEDGKGRKKGGLWQEGVRRRGTRIEEG